MGMQSAYVFSSLFPNAVQDFFAALSEEILINFH